MSGQTHVAMSWSTARIVSTLTPWRSMIPVEIAASPSVFEISGDRLSVQLTKIALRSE